MVVELTGIIDGQDIVFRREKEDWWSATIPPNLNGIYIVELTAIDEAGNVSYTTKYIITIDTSLLRVTLQPLKYYSKLLSQNYYAKMVS